MSQSLSFAFGRHERLKSDVLISRLYTEGKSISKYPIRLTYLIHTQDFYSDSSVKVSINAGKKGLRLAVNRNRMKRLLREVYRHNKHPFINFAKKHNCCISMGVVYVGTQLSDYQTVERVFVKVLRRVMEAVEVETAKGVVVTESHSNGDRPDEEGSGPANPKSTSSDIENA